MNPKQYCVICLLVVFHLHGADGRRRNFGRIKRQPYASVIKPFPDDELQDINLQIISDRNLNPMHGHGMCRCRNALTANGVTFAAPLYCRQPLFYVRHIVLTAGQATDISIIVSAVFGRRNRLHNLTDLTNAQTSLVSSFIQHELFSRTSGEATMANDIAIIRLANPITTNNYIKFLTLPPDDSYTFTDKICTIIGWGRVDLKYVLSPVLQQADIPVISTRSCARQMYAAGGVRVWDKQICVYDNNFRIGACNGDSGGSLNCPDRNGGYYLAGITSWGLNEKVNGATVCLTDYPGVFTRTSSYSDWIAQNMN